MKLIKVRFGGIRSMLIRNLKSFSDARFPGIGEVIESYETKECFGKTYFLCQYNNLFIPLKKSDVELIEEKKNGQLSLF